VRTIATLCLVTSCTFEQGGWFADLEATLDARLVATPDRDVGDG
jgi:hypothetical protein